MKIPNWPIEGIRDHHTYRERRVIVILNVVSIVFGVLLPFAAYFNYKAGEPFNALVILIMAAFFLLNILWNRNQWFVLSKLVLCFGITSIPIINVIATGRIPDGQFLSLPIISIIFCITAIILFDHRQERILYYFSIGYYSVMILFMDRFLMALSDRVTVIPFLEENYIYYKIPPMLGLFGVVIMVTLFKNTIYNYESENERIKEKLHIKNDELEKIVNERTQALKQSTDRVINMAFITSHEIRGPLASILSITELLQKQPDDEQIKEMIPRLHERSMQMDEVIKKMNKALSEEASTEER